MTKPTKIPGIPKPPSDVSPGLRGWLSSVAEALEIRLGRRGDPKDRAVTLRELIDAGLAEDIKAARFDPNNVNSTNLGIGPRIVIDPTVPPAPTSFTAAAGYSQINLSWDYPNYGSHSFTEIYGHSTDVIGDAQLIGVSTGRVYIDPIGSGASKYYWIRHVSTSSVTGPWNSGTGTLGQTATDVAHQLNVLAGAITSSELATSLATPIANLPSDTTTSISNLQTQINTLSTVAAWASGTSYSTNDLATFSGNLYEAAQAHTASSSNQPTGSTSNNSYWTYVGAYTSLASAVAGNTSDITDINYISSSSGSAAAQKIAALDSTVNNSSTGVSATATAVSGLTTRVTNTENATTSNTTNITANTSDITNLENTVNNSTTGVAATATAVSNLTTRVTNTENATTSNSTDITSLENTVNDSSTGVAATATALSGLTTRVTSTENATAGNTASITANTSDITSLENTVNDSSTGVAATATALSGLTTRVTSTENATTSNTTNITANTSDITALENTVNDSSTGVAATATALSGLTTRVTNTENATTGNTTNITANTSDITSLENTVNNPSTGVSATATAVSNLTTRVTNTENATTANSSDITALENTVNDSSTGVSATASAVSSLTTTVTNQGNTITSQGNTLTSAVSDITTLNTTVGGNSTSIQTNATSINGLQGQYSVKIDTNGHVAGFGLSNTAVNGTPTSAFIVRADKFAVIDPADTSNNLTNSPSSDVVPFIISGGDTYLRSAMIQDASITNAKIGSLDANKITAGTLNADRIAGNSIDASKIKLDGASITSNSSGQIVIGSISAGSITSGTLDASNVTITNLYADNITGDINTLTPFSIPSAVQITGTDTQIWGGQFPAQTKAKKPYVSAVGFGNWENDVVYKVKLQMKPNLSVTTTTVGTITAANAFTILGYTSYSVRVSGDKQSVVFAGGALKIGSSIRGTVTTSAYDTSSDRTIIYYIPQSGGFTSSDVGSTLSIQTTNTWQTVSEIMFRANFDDHPEQFSISGGLATAYTVTVDVRIMADTYATNYQALPTTAHNTNWTHDQVFALDGLMMALR